MTLLVHYLEETISIESLSLLAGAALSLLFAYVPGLSGWFDGLDSTYKRLVMGASIVVVGAASYGLGCAGLEGAITCSTDSAWVLVKLIGLTLVANQSTYSLGVK